jgi:hypothetical protein
MERTCSITLPYEYMSPCVVTVETLLPAEIGKYSGAAQRIDPPIDDVIYKGPQASATMLERPKSARNTLMSPRVVIEISYTLNELETGPIEYN